MHSKRGATMGRHLLIAQWLLVFAFTASATDPKRDALWAAVRSGEVEAVKKAFADGADPKSHNEYGVTALWIAAGTGKLPVVELLVEKGADVNARDGVWYQTPLTSAVGSGS